MSGKTNVEGPSSSGSVRNKPTTIFIPPRGPVDSLFTNGLSGAGFSPGPMTLVSGYFAEQSPFSFSQLLAMASPKPDGFSADAGNNNNRGSNNDGVGSNLGFREERNEGYKKNRPVNLVVNQSPNMQQMEGLSQHFMVPPGLSPGGLLTSPGFLSPLQSPFGMSHQQALAHVTAQAALSQSSTFMQMQTELQRSSPLQPETSAQPAPSEPESSKIESPEYSEPEKKTTTTNTYVSGDKPANDGYNWRKYGQKHVKGSECPRSYYKCTHLNCPVKKKVERSGDGHISEIIYKGHHNHDPPPPQCNNKRGKDGNGISDKTSKGHQIEAGNDDGVNDEAALVSSDPANLLQRSFEQHCLGSAGNNEEIREDSAIVVDGDDDEPIAKRRSIEMPVSLHQTVTESKIVVQTRSEVDLLDDGFRWRKYGQKVVKGNPYPRSYYRCTYAGCNVRKHVERSSADPKSVITTYEGKHSHEIPLGKYSNKSAHQQLKMHKNAVKEPNPLSRETDFGNRDHQMPMTLQLKQEHVAA